MFLATSSAATASPAFYLVSGDVAVYLYDTQTVAAAKKVGIPVVTLSPASFTALTTALKPAAEMPWMSFVDDGISALVDGGGPNTQLYIDDFDGGASTDITVASTRTNLATDPSFEYGLVGFTPQSTTLARSTTWADTGTNSLQVTPNGGSADSAACIGGPTTFPFGMQPGLTYTISATVYVPSAMHTPLDGRACSILVYGLTSGFSVVTWVQSNAGPTGGGAQRVSVNYTVPTTGGIAGVQIRFYNGSSNVTDLVYWDSILVEQSSYLGTYFDGDGADTAAITRAWTGTPGASTSTETQTVTDAAPPISGSSA